MRCAYLASLALDEDLVEDGDNQELGVAAIKVTLEHAMRLAAEAEGAR